MPGRPAPVTLAACSWACGGSSRIAWRHARHSPILCFKRRKHLVAAQACCESTGRRPLMVTVPDVVPRCPLPDEVSLTLFAWECNAAAPDKSPYTDINGRVCPRFPVVGCRQSAGIIVLNPSMRGRNDFLPTMLTMVHQGQRARVQKAWKNGTNGGAFRKVLRKRKFFAQVCRGRKMTEGWLHDTSFQAGPPPAGCRTRRRVMLMRPAPISSGRLPVPGWMRSMP